MATKKQTKNHDNHRKHTLLILGLALLATVLIIVVGAVVAVKSLNAEYEFTVYPGVSVAGADLSGLEYVAALEAVEERVAEFENAGVTVQFQQAQQASVDVDGNPTVVIMPVNVPLEASGNDYEVYDIDIDATVDAAYQYGRSGTGWDAWVERYNIWRNGAEVAIRYTVDSEYVEGLLEEQFAQFESPAIDANMQLNAEGELEITDEIIGSAFDFESVTVNVERAIADLDTDTIVIELEPEQPGFTRTDVEEHESEIKQVLSIAFFNLIWEDNAWRFEDEVYGTWLTFVDGELAIDPEKMDVDLTEVHAEVDIAPQEARWQVNTDEEGKVVDITELTPTQVGRDVNEEVTAEAIMQWLANEAASGNDPKGDQIDESQDVALVVEETQPQVHAENVNELGINDLLGTGYSNMSGSPYNRRANIDRGIALLNGLLVAPEETFSLVESLKPFTLENGYVAELVIKGNETIPEIGGGLCQVGSTTFRAAMNSGLDIIERRNHSYAVSYYSDHRNGLPGTDATIYDSSPDFKFYNDTGNYILLQTRRDGMDLYFDFWGQSDGRVAEYSAPTITGWIAPPPTKEIETTELAPGERNCTESAHAGTTASFDYTISYPDGTAHAETFTSTYKPWQAVCLVGKAAEEEQQESEEAPAEEAAETEDDSDTSDDKDDSDSSKKKDNDKKQN